MKKTNFDIYLEEQLKDSAFARAFKKAGAAWERKFRRQPRAAARRAASRKS